VSLSFACKHLTTGRRFLARVLSEKCSVSFLLISGMIDVQCIEGRVF
jgi:hypothetical protein